LMGEDAPPFWSGNWSPPTPPAGDGRYVTLPMSARSDSCRAHCLTGGWASTKAKVYW